MVGLGVVVDPTELETAGGIRVRIAPVGPDDEAELFALFAAVVAAGEGYPQAPDQPVDLAGFRAYWLVPARVAAVARQVTDDELVGAYTLKANGIGRAAHVANAGYVVASGFRGRGLGRALVEDSFTRARAEGFDAMQFNFVFASNPARRLYERMGFELIGQVPDVIDGEAVCIYWRRL
jgi:GNAT superfamily N-acetyltransferase